MGDVGRDVANEGMYTPPPEIRAPKMEPDQLLDLARMTVML